MENLLELEGVARSYFNNLFTAGDCGNYDYVLSGSDCCVSEEYNGKLTAAYTKEEIRAVVFELGATKAPGEDGFQPCFSRNAGTLLEMRSLLIAYKY